MVFISNADLSNTLADFTKKKNAISAYSQNPKLIKNLVAHGVPGKRQT